MYYITFYIYFINFNHFTVCLPKINKMVDNSDFGVYNKSEFESHKQRLFIFIVFFALFLLIIDIFAS